VGMAKIASSIASKEIFCYGRHFFPTVRSGFNKVFATRGKNSMLEVCELNPPPELSTGWHRCVVVHSYRDTRLQWLAASVWLVRRLMSQEIARAWLDVRIVFCRSSVLNSLVVKFYCHSFGVISFFFFFVHSFFINIYC